MRVSCTANTGVHLPEFYRKRGYHKEYEFPLLIGKSYIVYGMNLWDGRIGYLIMGEARKFPDWLPSELFEIGDGKLSRYWHYGVNLDNLDNTIDSIWGYKELANHSGHFDKLVDRDRTALATFMHYKELMDLEFPDPLISDSADGLEENWLFCPKCTNAWETHSLDAMVKCPNCESILKNPRYSAEK